MKKFLISAIAVLATVAACYAAPRSIYVKSGDTYTKYNFGVAEDLRFSADGKRLYVTGYAAGIELDKIDYITFEAPIDNTALSPSKQKEKMIEIGQKAFNLVDLNDNAELIKMIDVFFDRYVGYEFYESDFNLHGTDDEVEYEGGDHNRTRGIAKMLQAVKQMAGGNPSAAFAAQNGALDVWQASDFYGVFNAGVDEEWEKIANAEYTELRFPAKDGDFYKVRATTEGKGTVWTEAPGSVAVPDKVVLTIVKGNDQLAQLTVAFTPDPSLKMLGIKVNCEANGYVVTNNTLITNSGIDTKAEVTIKGTKFITTDARINGINLTDYDKWKAEMDNATDDDEYYDNENNQWIWVDGNRDNLIAHHFTNATADVDLLGELQVKAKVMQFPKLYDMCSQETYTGLIQTVDKENFKVTEIWDDIDLVKRQADYYNNYCDASFYYDGTSQIQGFLSFEASIDTWSYVERGYYDRTLQDFVDTDHYYETTAIEGFIQPIFTFPDLTSYAFDDEQYFNEKNFKKLITDWDELIETYDKLVDREEDDLLGDNDIRYPY